MKSLMYMLSALAVMGLAFWAYHENYKTQAALDEVQELQHEIGSLLETRSVLNAEWAYLNRPDRIEKLTSRLLPGLDSLSVDQISGLSDLPDRPAIEEENDTAIGAIGGALDVNATPVSLEVSQ